METSRLFRISDTPGITAMNRGAVGEERNRALSDEAIAALDPAGIHVLTFSMPHSHIAGVKVEPHLRTLWMLKLKGVNLPAEGFIDVSFKDFDSYTYETNAIPTKEQE